MTVTAPETPLYRRPLLPSLTGGPLRPGGLELTAHALELAGLEPGARILDLGCGNGASLALARERGLRPIGLDRDSELLGQARMRPGLVALEKKSLRRPGGMIPPGPPDRAAVHGPSASARPMNGRPEEGVWGESFPPAAGGVLPQAPAAQPPSLLQADAMRLPLRGASLDAVLCECVLSLLPDPAAALAEIRRVLRPGGALLLNDLYRREDVDEVDRESGGSCACGAMTPRQLEELLAGSGFRVLRREDRSRELANLAAMLLFAGDGLEALSPLARDCGRSRARLGYALWLACSDNPHELKDV